MGTDLAWRAGTLMGGCSKRCKERSFSNAEFSGVWAYNPKSVVQGYFNYHAVPGFSTACTYSAIGRRYCGGKHYSVAVSDIV